MASAPTYSLSGLNHTARTLAVYASQRRLPDATQDSLPAAWPGLAGRDNSLRGTLNGNRAALEKNYLMNLSGNPEKWVLTLLPSEQKIAALVQRITVSGSRDQIRSIEYLQADGDRSLMLIESLDNE